MRVKLRNRVEWTTVTGLIRRGKVVYIGRDEPRIVAVQPDGTLDELGMPEWKLRAYLRDDRYCSVHGIDLVPPPRTLRTRRYCNQCPPGSALGYPTWMTELPAGTLPVDDPANARCTSVVCPIGEATPEQVEEYRQARDAPDEMGRADNQGIRTFDQAWACGNVARQTGQEQRR